MKFRKLLLLSVGAGFLVFLGGCSDLTSTTSEPRIQRLGPPQTFSSLDTILNHLDRLDPGDVEINNLRGEEISVRELKRRLRDTSSSEKKTKAGSYNVTGYSFIDQVGFCAPNECREVVFKAIAESSAESEWLQNKIEIRVESTGYREEVTETCPSMLIGRVESCVTNIGYALSGSQTECSMDTKHEGESAYIPFPEEDSYRSGTFRTC